MTSVLLVGCGKMGGALLAGWRANNAADSFVVVEPMQQSLTDILGVSGVTVVKEFSEIPGDFKPNAIVMAVKPQADRKSTRLNSSHSQQSRMPSSA